MAEGKPLKVAPEAVGMAKSSYYYRSVRRRKPRRLDKALVGAINEVRRGYAEVYGYRKVTMTLRAAKWAGSANVYLCVVIDTWDRDIIGDVFSDRCRTQEAAEALESVVLSCFGGRVPYSHELTLRVDRGPQFTARSFREVARILNARLEYAEIRCPEDKSYVESFFGSYKTEELYRNEYNNLAEARTGWGNYRVWYRYDRLHQGLRYRSPREYAKITQKTELLVA